MISMQAFIEGLYVTVLGVTVVFLVLIILALAMYGIGYLEKLLIEEKPRTKKAVEEKGVEEVMEEKEEVKIEPRKLAVITAAILAYMGEKNAQLRPLPFKKKVRDYWSLYGLQTQMDEVENFNYNYELGKW